MTKLKLKKHLAVLPKEDVMNLVLSLYDASAEAKMYLELYLTPDYSAALEKYKKIIRNEFFPDRGFSDKPSFATCRKAISDFKKLKADAISLGDLMLYYIELGCEYTMTFGDMWEQYYTTLETNFEKALKHISDHDLEEHFRQRIESMLNSTHCGWGFSDTLWDMYYDYYGYQE